MFTCCLAVTGGDSIAKCDRLSQPSRLSAQDIVILSYLLYVTQEMQRLDDDSNVYKLIGPVLVKQDQEEAKQNVQKRIDYINTEL